MKNKITLLLNELEYKHNIDILFAVESGSRLYKQNNKDSDYDVRFVYIKKPNQYLSLNKTPDFIEFKDEQDNIDIVGFDIYKFFNLYIKSNSNMIEWLESDIIYIDKEDFKITLRKKINHLFNPKALYLNYRGMSIQVYTEKIKDKEYVDLKSYLRCIRTCMCMYWIKYTESIPCLSIKENMDLVVNVATFKNEVINNQPDLVNELEILLRMKDADIQKTMPSNQILNKFIETTLSNIPEITETARFDDNVIKILDEIILNILNKYKHYLLKGG